MNGTEIKIDTWYEPGTNRAIVTVTYAIDPLRLMKPGLNLKGRFLKVFKQMHDVAFQFIQELIMSERGFKASRHEEHFDESRALPQNGIIKGEVVK